MVKIAVRENMKLQDKAHQILITFNLFYIYRSIIHLFNCKPKVTKDMVFFTRFLANSVPKDSFITAQNKNFKNSD